MVDGAVPFEIRVCAWFKLIKMWASMRFDDAAHLKTSELRFYDGQLVGMMHQSKTTGPGKRVRELPIFIAKDAYVLRDDWLQVGFDLVKLQMPRDRDYVFPESCFYGMVYGASHVAYAEAVAGSTKTLAVLEGYHGRLIPSGWERFWSEHSERATLSSGLAALGVEKSDRDLLGRWCPEGSDVYVRTYNAIVKKMQKRIVAVLRGEAAYEELDEGSILEELKVWLREKWTVPQDQADSVVEQEVLEGLMAKMEEEKFIEVYGENRAVAALAVLVEDGAQWLAWDCLGPFMDLGTPALGLAVDRVLANHSLSSTASQGRSNIPLSFFPALGITPPGQEQGAPDPRRGPDVTRLLPKA